MDPGLPSEANGKRTRPKRDSTELRRKGEMSFRFLANRVSLLRRAPPRIANERRCLAKRNERLAGWLLPPQPPPLLRTSSHGVARRKYRVMRARWRRTNTRSAQPARTTFTPAIFSSRRSFALRSSSSLRRSSRPHPSRPMRSHVSPPLLARPFALSPSSRRSPRLFGPSLPRFFANSFDRRRLPVSLSPPRAPLRDDVIDADKDACA